MPTLPREVGRWFPGRGRLEQGLGAQEGVRRLWTVQYLGSQLVLPSDSSSAYFYVTLDKSLKSLTGRQNCRTVLGILGAPLMFSFQIKDGKE